MVVLKPERQDVATIGGLVAANETGVGNIYLDNDTADEAMSEELGAATGFCGADGASMSYR